MGLEAGRDSMVGGSADFRAGFRLPDSIDEAMVQMFAPDNSPRQQAALDLVFDVQIGTLAMPKIPDVDLANLEIVQAEVDLACAVIFGQPVDEAAWKALERKLEERRVYDDYAARLAREDQWDRVGIRYPERMNLAEVGGVLV